MSLLSKAVSGVTIKPQIYVFFGPNGCGKTTLACHFEKPIIADLEDGSGQVQTDRQRLTPEDIPSLETFLSLIQDLHGSHAFKTFIIDSVESLESLVHKHICEKNSVTSIEDVGFGKGYVMAREKMEEIMQSLVSLRNKKNMNVILVAHSQTKTYTDPNLNVSYDRTILRANDKFASIIKDLSDSIFFITYKVDTVDQKGKEKVKAFGDDKRVIYTSWRPGYDAKSRYPVDQEIEYTKENVKEVIEKLTPKSPDVLYVECSTLLKQVKDEEKKSKAHASIEASKGDITKLLAIKNRLMELRGQP